MKESFEVAPQVFKYPSIEREEGEFERVAQTFGIETSVLMFQARNGELITLNEKLWQKLENTDSNRFETGDWEKVEEFSNSVDRDWNDLKNKLAAGTQLDAPIIMQFGDRYHLVSGNTRLMVARAEGLKPTVLLFEVDTPDTTTSKRDLD